MAQFRAGALQVVLS